MELQPKPNKEMTIQNKNRLRNDLRKKRRAISDQRGSKASSKAIVQLSALFKQHPNILSYASFGDEFDTQEINQYLLSEGKLALPKVDGNTLRIYHVEDVNTQLKKNCWGILEPIPTKCREADVSKISLGLVPGIAFDAVNHRLGYGKGFYDRFLPKLSKTSLAYGLGFKEQYSSTPLPTSPSDHPLHGLLLF